MLKFFLTTHFVGIFITFMCVLLKSWLNPWLKKERLMEETTKESMSSSFFFGMFSENSGFMFEIFQLPSFWLAYRRIFFAIIALSKFVTWFWVFLTGSFSYDLLLTICSNPLTITYYESLLIFLFKDRSFIFCIFPLYSHFALKHCIDVFSFLIPEWDI